MKHQTLSRVAERSYWLGRYVERVESTARLITVNANLLIDFPMRLPLGWKPLIDISGASGLFDSLYDAVNERNVVRFLTSETRNPSSIVSSIASARENARTIRETMPRVTFELINDLYLYAKSELGGPLSRARRIEVLNGIARRVQQLEGFLSANMMHDATWSFLRAGSHLERADMTTRIIDVRSSDLLLDASDLLPFQNIQWRSVLRSLYAMQSYHASMGEPVDRSPVLEFLFKSAELPRSYLRCLNAIRISLRSLPRAERPLRTCNRMIRNVRQADVSDLEGPALHAFIDQCQVQLADLHDEIGKTYFYFKPRIRRA